MKVCRLALSLLVLAAPALAQTPEPVASAAPEASPTPYPSPTEIPWPEAPGGNWLTDEKGRQYYIEKLPKSAQYQELGDHQIRSRLGITYDVVGQDEETFHVKTYRVERPSPRAPLPTHPAVIPMVPAAAVERTVSPLTASHRFRFQNFGKGLPESGQWRNGFDVGDLNGDGHPDILHGSARKSFRGPALFLGDGQGNWRSWKEAQLPAAPYDYGDAAVADFNGDGKLDLALGIHLTGLLVLVGDGKGQFKTWSDGLALQKPGAGPAFSSRAIAAGDWNGDGKPDLLALGEGPRPGGFQKAEGGRPAPSTSFGPAVFFNKGDGSWTERRPKEGSQGFGDSLATGDFNDDGKLDLATGANWLGRSDLIHLGQQDGGLSPLPIPALPAQAYVWAVAAGDFDKNGRDDLVVGYSSLVDSDWKSGVDLLYSQADGTFKSRNLALEAGQFGVFALGAGDLDGDGAKDLVATTGDGRVWVFAGDGQGFLTREDAPELATVGNGCRGYHVRLTDLDGDAKDEIVLNFAGEAASNDAGCTSGGSLQAWKAVSKP